MSPVGCPLMSKAYTHLISFADIIPLQWFYGWENTVMDIHALTPCSSSVKTPMYILLLQGNRKRDAEKRIFLKFQRLFNHNKHLQHFFDKETCERFPAWSHFMPPREFCWDVACMCPSLGDTENISSVSLTVSRKFNSQLLFFFRPDPHPLVAIWSKGFRGITVPVCRSPLVVPSAHRHAESHSILFISSSHSRLRERL